LCGCTPQELASRTVEENLALCQTCGILNHCSYPKAIAMGMVKSDSAQPTVNTQASSIPRSTSKPTGIPTDSKPNLQKLAQTSENFSEFHDKSHAYNRLDSTDTKQPPTERRTKQAPRRTKKNLKETAATALNMADYLNQVHEE
jgi:hypothetical protein